MTERISWLRRESLAARERLSGERALLVTAFYQSGIAQKASVPMQRALNFNYLMEHKSLWLGDGELIVGERGPAPKATPTYPEICLHGEADLEIIHSREKVSFAVSEETKAAYRETVIPFWTGKSIREKIFEEVPDDWEAAYRAGVFTEFQEQRTPGHTVLGEKLFRKGFLDLKQEIARAMSSLDYYGDPGAFARKQQLAAMDVAADGIIAYASRYAALLDERAAKEADPERRAELAQMAGICRRVPADSPRTFWEALQHYWFVHLGVITELNPWDAFNPGRLDQHLYPFFRRETAAGTLTGDRARELLQAFWIKFNNHPSPPKTGVTARESNTYTDFALINLGGVKRDGSDAVNDLTYLILDVIREMRLLQPSAMIQLSKKSPDRFLKQALRIVRTGYGQPSIFNTDSIVQELVRQGKGIEDAREGGASGCVESGAFGREAYFLTGYFNIPKILELTFHNGVDPASGEMIGIETGPPADFADFEEFFEAFSRQLRHFVDIKIKGNNIIERIHAAWMPVPFLSLLIDDCIERGKDYTDGGARYNTSYIQGVGLGTITDALAAVKTHVFEQKTLAMADLLRALKDDFTGHEALRDVLLNETPKFGNDDDEADDVMRRVFELYHGAINGRPNTRGGVHRINLLPTTVHVYFGGRIGALPDGRKAGAPLSEGISPVQGADRRGPTAVIKSAAKIDHLRTGGTLLNQKFLPQVVADDTGIDKLAHLVRAYFKLDGHHIQFNVVDAETLKRARAAPDDYRDLIVRVAGYSDYFVDLTPELQDEIIRRTAHDGL
ncbi:trans-4-hydroxy-L-proline dehydratase [Desulfococcus sp.]|uniref:trans-4-hydroxy-L-proline dehydratase n=1 Tax=Desulfococcus sp. TaxID=2025834 RepID=UPI0035933AFA